MYLLRTGTYLPATLAILLLSYIEIIGRTKFVRIRIVFVKRNREKKLDTYAILSRFSNFIFLNWYDIGTILFVSNENCGKSILIVIENLFDQF